MNLAAKRSMTVDEFYDWCERQPGGRYELYAGEVVAMSPERVAHVRLKQRLWRLLTDAIRDAGLACEALGDGVAVRIDERTSFEPDALVHCGPDLPGDAVEAPEPLVVVEVISPSSRGVDTGAKLNGYFQVPSLRHYLIVDGGRGALIHHAREEGGDIRTRIHKGGTLRLDPPGIGLNVAAVLGA
ncbi:MAG: Uma2 family endonuclease [Geminicoccaceae bacterium]|nr:Uma2 family endonuclease [Geminicoccaceae bacterium]